MSEELNKRSSIEDKSSEEELSPTSSCSKSVRSSIESSKSSGFFSKIKSSVGLKSKSKEPSGIQSARSGVDTGSSSGISVPKSIVEIPRLDHEFLSASLRSSVPEVETVSESLRSGIASPGSSSGVLRSVRSGLPVSTQPKAIESSIPLQPARSGMRSAEPGLYDYLYQLSLQQRPQHYPCHSNDCPHVHPIHLRADSNEMMQLEAVVGREANRRPKKTRRASLARGRSPSRSVSKRKVSSGGRRGTSRRSSRRSSRRRRY